MNVLLVDDLPAIVESLKNGVNWQKSGVKKVSCANSVKEAKLLLMNFSIDVLLCDIEMPEENGLELAGWAKGHVENLECIFLTSHAEFDYIMEAMHLGSFDYVLQPVKFEDVENVLLKVGKKVQETRRYRKLDNFTRKTEEQGNHILELMLVKKDQDRGSEANKICRDYMELCGYLFEDCVVFQVLIKVVRWKNMTQIRKEKEIKELLYNTFTNLLEEYHVRIAVAMARKDSYWVLIFSNRNYISEKVWQQKIQEFYQFVTRNLDFSIAVYPTAGEGEKDFIEVYRKLEEAGEDNSNGQSGIFAEKQESMVGKGMHSAIAQALKYIERNMNKNLSRLEVAKAVSISEEYFSKLFRQKTGATFKEYVLMMKMEEAKVFLRDTCLSISIIASKVGYSNFSHFSQMFRSYVGMTPQEYRKREKDETK